MKWRRQNNGRTESSTMKNTFKVINDAGEEIVCDILFTFDSTETNKSYIVYTDMTKDEFGNVNVYASIYNPPDTRLYPIETEKEWRVVEKILAQLQEEVRSGKNLNEEEIDDGF